MTRRHLWVYRGIMWQHWSAGSIGIWVSKLYTWGRGKIGHLDILPVGFWWQHIDAGILSVLGVCKSPGYLASRPEYVTRLHPGFMSRWDCPCPEEKSQTWGTGWSHRVSLWTLGLVLLRALSSGGTQLSAVGPGAKALWFRGLILPSEISP